ncbi:MAG: cysteine desulfurase family protein [Planctomycetota bacterium]
MKAYLDNNATTRPLPEVVSAMSEALEHCWANPSSIHRPGQTARARVEKARRAMADLLGVGPREVVFCSGGTESCQIAIRGALGRPDFESPTPWRTMVTSPVEHSAVRDLAKSFGECDGHEVRWLPVDGRGVVDVEAARGVITEGVCLVSLQWVNNETGAVQPVEEIGEMARAAGALMHVDGTQWVGRMPANLQDMPFDMLTCSAHKFHGPKGVGVLWIRRGVKLCKLTPGSQELGRRGGTENVPGIVGLGVAASQAAEWLADEGHRERIAAQRDRLEREILGRVPGASVNGSVGPHCRLYNTTNIALPGVDAEIILLTLAEMGVCASAGSACSSGSLEPSPVLCAMGVDTRLAAGSLRLSLSRFTTDDEVSQAADAIAEAWRVVTAAI